MKYFILFLLLIATIDTTDAKKLAVYKELHSVNKSRVEILKAENQILKRKLEETRTMLKKSNASNQTLIDGMSDIQQQFAALQASYRKKIATGYATIALAVGGFPIGALIGWGVRGLVAHPLSK